MSVAGTGSGDGIQLVDIRLNDDNIAVVGGASQQKAQKEKNTSRAR